MMNMNHKTINRLPKHLQDCKDRSLQLMILTFTILLLFIGLHLYIHGPLLTNYWPILPTKDQYPQKVVKSTKSDTKYSKVVYLPPCVLSFPCAMYFELVQHPRCYANDWSKTHLQHVNIESSSSSLVREYWNILLVYK